MLHLDSKDYDLNTLFSFEVLKEILLKLARAQVNLEEKVQNIINVYQNKDNSDRENEFNYYETEENMNITDKDSINDEEGENKSKFSETKNNEIKEIKQNEKAEQSNITQKTYVDSEFKEKDIDKEQKENENVNKDKKEENLKDENKVGNNQVLNDKEEAKKEKKEDNNQIQNNREDKEKYKISNKDEISYSKASTYENKKSENKGVAPDLIKNMSRAIKENKARITALEAQLKKIKII